MDEHGIRAKDATVADLGLADVSAAYWNLTPAELIEKTITDGEGILTDTKALAINTGKFTGRSPKDRFIVCDDKTKDTVWWGDINIKFDPDKFDRLYKRMAAYLTGKKVYVRDAYVCADPKYRLNIRVVTELPWKNLFAFNMFLRPSKEEIENFKPEWTIISAP